jgi:RluA family pseudouridine synthase
MSELEILEDWKDVIAVNKPAGWLSIPGRGNKEKIPIVSDELGQLLRRGQPREQNKTDLYIIHRLDQGTSGVMLFSRTSESHKVLSQQFLAGQIKKKYLAVVSGQFPAGDIKIDAPVFKLPSKKNKSVVDPKGKASQTVVRLIATNNKFSLVEAMPLTGRPHQIRVHLKHIGFPLVGDKLYGGVLNFMTLGELSLPLLHAREIIFHWPEGVERRAHAALKGEFLKATQLMNSSLV